MHPAFSNDRFERRVKNTITVITAVVFVGIGSILVLAGWAGCQIHKHGLKGAIQRVWEGPPTNSVTSPK